MLFISSSIPAVRLGSIVCFQRTMRAALVRTWTGIDLRTTREIAIP